MNSLVNGYVVMLMFFKIDGSLDSIICIDNYVYVKFYMNKKIFIKFIDILFVWYIYFFNYWIISSVKWDF